MFSGQKEVHQSVSSKDILSEFHGIISSVEVQNDLLHSQRLSGTFLYSGSSKAPNYLRESDLIGSLPNICEKTESMSAHIFQECLLGTVMKSLVADSTIVKS